MTNTRKAVKDLAGLTLSAGIAYATGFMPATFISNIIGEVAKSLTADYIKNSDFKRIKEMLIQTHPSELNHDLQKLVLKSVEWSIKNIELLYIEKNNLPKNDYRTIRLRNENTELIRSLKKVSFDKHVLTLHEEVENIKEAHQFFQKIDIKINQLHNIITKSPYGEFFEKEFPAMLKLCFGELLKKEENKNALVAYEREVKQTINKKLDKILSQVENTSAVDLEEISQTKIKEVRYKVNSLNLEDFVETVNGQYVTIAKDLGYLKDSFDLVLDKLESNYFEKNKVYIFGCGGGLLVVICVLLYYINSMPFTTNVVLELNPELKVHPMYPLLDEGDMPKIAFYLNEKIIRDITTNGATLTELNPSYKNKNIKVELIDEYWKLSDDSLKIGKGSFSLNIEPNNRLSTISGRVFKHIGHEPIKNAKIIMVNEGIETQVDSMGIFKIEVPIEFRRPKYLIRVIARDVDSITTPIIPGSDKAISL